MTPARNLSAHDKEFFDLEDFEKRIVGSYNEGHAPSTLPADVTHARSIIGPGSGRLRDFSYIAPEIPEFLPDNCVGCMDCVTMCPDTAILGKVVSEETLQEGLLGLEEDQSEEMQKLWPWFASTGTTARRRGRNQVASAYSSIRASARAVQNVSTSAVPRMPSP